MKKILLCLFLLQIVSCHFGTIEPKPEATKLSIKNNSIVQLSNVIWNGADFGDISSGGVSEKEVSDGFGYVYFYVNGKQYYTETVVGSKKHKHEEFSFINETLITDGISNSIILRDLLNVD